MSRTAEYAVLPGADPDGEETKGSSNSRVWYFARLPWGIVIIQALAILYLMGQVRWNLKGLSTVSDISHQPYSPAQEALETELRIFSMGIGSQTTPYEGEPSKTLDEAWDNLYNDFGISKIPKEQAKLLPNKTSPIPGDENNYIVSLSVFHQLHCLNVIRKALRPDYYKDPVTGSIADIPPELLPEHLGHCIGSLRQSLMCSSDASVIVWRWSEFDQSNFPRMDTVHTCRNFDKVVEWAKAHRLVGHFDSNIHIEDDIAVDVS